MATSYTTLLGLALPVTGELAGTWGDTVNNYLTQYLDASVAGTQTLSTDADVTLTKTTGTSLGATSSQYAVLNCTGARTALRTITVPAASKTYLIINATTGGYSVKLVGAGPTTGLTIPNGASALVAWNGSDFIEIGSGTIGNLTVNGNLTVTGTTTLSGGTANGVLYLNGSKVVTSGSTISFDGTTFTSGAHTLSTGNLTFSSTAQRITGDMSNATASNRLSFQTSTTNNNTALQILPNGTGTVANLFLFNNSDPTNAAFAQIGAANGGAEVTVRSAILGTGTYLPMTFYTGGSERVRIDTSGNVGIGTTPNVELALYKATLPRFHIQNSTSGVQSNDGLQLALSGSDAYVWNFENGATIFGTNNTERMRIDSSGNLTCAGVYSATVGATNRDVYVDNTGLIGYVSSIRASKTNIAPLDNPSWLLQLQPVTFNYRAKDEDGKYTDTPDGPQQYGLIAEDVEAVAPDLCYYDEVEGQQELRGINYSRLITPLLKLVQDQQAAIETLTRRIAALEAKG